VQDRNDQDALHVNSLLNDSFDALYTI
jgi:hypothetical protein